MINRKRYSTGAKVFLVMYAIAVIVTVAALVHVL